MLCGYHKVYGTCHRFQCAILLFLNLISLDVMRRHLRMEANVNWDVCQVDEGWMKGMRASIHQFKGLATLANQFINIYQKQIERAREFKSGPERNRDEGAASYRYATWSTQPLCCSTTIQCTMHKWKLCRVLFSHLCGGPRRRPLPLLTAKKHATAGKFITYEWWIDSRLSD